MAKWRKQFDQWENAKSPVRKTEVETLLRRVFADRLRFVEGTSHQFIISVPELQETASVPAQGTLIFPFGECGVPVDRGQQVKAFYLRRAYQVALLLELYPPSQSPEDQEEDNERDSNERTLE